MGAVQRSGRNHRVRIVLAASEPSLRRSLARDLRGAGFAICAVEDRVPAAIRAVSAHLPDVFVVATDLGESAVIAAARVADGVPRTKVVVAAEAPDEDDCLTYLMVGASGYVGIEAGCASVAAAIRGVVDGQAVVPPAAQRRLLDELRAVLE
jgi:DNA-binding NarL/FixJ family response regulator